MFYELARPFLFHLDPEVAHDSRSPHSSASADSARAP